MGRSRCRQAKPDRVGQPFIGLDTVGEKNFRIAQNWPQVRITVPSRKCQCDAKRTIDMKLKTLITSAAFVGLQAGAALSAEYEIMALDGAFFPETTYLNAGDTVTILNVTETSMTISATDGSWTTGSMVSNASFAMQIDATTSLQFGNSAIPDMLGAFSFDPAPLD